LESFFQAEYVTSRTNEEKKYVKV